MLLQKIAVLPPVFVNTPVNPRFCLESELCTADKKRPAVPVIRAALVASATASFGWYTSSTVAMLAEESEGR